MLANRHYSCIIVDSTRRGKSMPDALSKTIPIWCAVINQLLFGETDGIHELSTPKDIVGASEHAHIEALLHGFVEDVKVTNTCMSHPMKLLAKKAESQSRNMLLTLNFEEATPTILDYPLFNVYKRVYTYDESQYHNLLYSIQTCTRRRNDRRWIHSGSRR